VVSVTTKRRRIDQIQDPEFLRDLPVLDADELRARRTMCDDLDLEFSYYRRMLHGRMDLISFEMRRRAGEETQTLLEALPRVLAGGAYQTEPGLPSRNVPVEAPDLPSPGRRQIDRALHGDFLTRLSELGDSDLRDTHRFIEELETEVSMQRRIVHNALDRLQAELARRYRDGLADPGEPLTRG
jgi:hypothetical protein